MLKQAMEVAMRAIVLICLGLTTWFADAAAARARPPDCAQTEHLRGSEVQSARLALTRIPVGDMDPRVGRAAQTAIERVKGRLVAFMTASLACAPSDESAAAVRDRLESRGHAFVDRNQYTADNHPNGHGDGLSYDADRPVAQPDLLVVVARLQIECGDDAVLLVFRRTAQGWRPVIVRRSAPYREISGAYGDLGYAVGPRDRAGRWYLAIAHAPPWCTSAWRTLRLDLSRPGHSPSAPHIFFRHEADLYSGEPFRLRAEPGRLELRHQGSIANTGLLIRDHIESYRISGDLVRRTDPVAFNARDFADEWVGMDWREAAQWSAPGQGLRRVHALLHPAPTGDQFWIDSVFRCHDGYQIAFARNLMRWYLFVPAVAPYRLARASQTTALGCGGPNLLPSNAEPRLG